MFHNLKFKKKETLCVDLWFLPLHLQEQYQQLQTLRITKGKPTNSNLHNSLPENGSFVPGR